MRYYNLDTDRYIRTDPIGFDGGDVNLYAYVTSNPINQFDTHGLILLQKFWVKIEKKIAPLIVASGTIFSGTFVAASGVMLAGASFALAPETFGLSLIGVPAGFAVTAAGEYLITFGTTMFLNYFNENFGLEFPSLSEHPRRFPEYPVEECHE